MTFLFSSLLLDDATKRRWYVAKLNHPRTSGPRALLKRKRHELYAQIALKVLTSPSLETMIGRKTADESGDKKIKARKPASKRMKQKP